MLGGQNQWDTGILQDIFITRDVDLISSIPINEMEPDTWYWRLEHHGAYTVKSAYNALQSNKNIHVYNDNIGFWKRLWQLKVPPKIKKLLWQASSKCLPTKTQLQLKHVPVNALCPLCNNDNESICHVLVSCSFARACWNRLSNCSIPISHGPFHTWLWAIFEKYSGEQRDLSGCI